MQLLGLHPGRSRALYRLARGSARYTVRPAVPFKSQCFSSQDWVSLKTVAPVDDLCLQFLLCLLSTRPKSLSAEFLK